MTDSASKTQVLIVGAGPTGLVLALWLTRFGVHVRIVDKALEPGLTSRAVGVQARTLELYRQAGLDRQVVEAGCPVRGLNIWVQGKHRGRLELGEIGRELSPFPYLLIYAQDEHEKLLIERLADVGVGVERPVELVAFEEAGDRVAATLRRSDGSTEVCESDYLAGCDGAHSLVREALKISFPGGTYEHLFYVADAAASGPTMNGEAHFALEDDGSFLACLALDARSHVRLIGTIRDDALAQGQQLGWDQVSKRVIQRLHLEVARVNWFSTYRVHHRVASAFRVSRVFLLGDAAHIHSPVGGQGMNTGIGDAVNLAWKLAAVTERRADARILDSYEEERVPFARRLVHTTDRAFELISSTSSLATFLRLHVVPQVLTALFHLAAVRRLLFRTVSQINVNYRGSSLSEGSAGGVSGGDRLPWVSDEDGHDNFAPLTSMDWQVHVYGEASHALQAACKERSIPVFVFPYSTRARTARLDRDAAYLIRPDGYVALAVAPPPGPDLLTRYFAARGEPDRLAVGGDKSG